MRTVIVGAGIAGLGTAVGLARSGHDVVVLERDERVQELGAGILLWPNALRALDLLGVRERVQSVAELGGPGGFRRPDGRWLARVDGARFAARYGEVAAIHRGALIDLLHDAAREAGARVCCGIEVTSVAPGLEGAVVSSVALEWCTDLVIGADGLRSKTRQLCLPGSPEPRPTGLAAWRWVVDWTGAGIAGGPVASVTMGAGMEFGIIPLPGEQVYCYASSARRRDGVTPGPEAYLSWCDPIPALIEEGYQTGMLCHELSDLPALPSFVNPSSRVALVGDAAHAMTPHLGQGAAQGLEDAACLARLATAGADASELLHAYEEKRRPRALAVQRASRQAMRALTLTRPVSLALRDATIQALPETLVAQALARWSAPNPST